MTVLVGVLTFVVVAGLLLVVFQPVFTQYVDSYAVRVRARKGRSETAAEVPKESVLLTTCKTVGQSLLGVLPMLADKRTSTLLLQANYRTPDHLAIFIGIKAVVVFTCVFFALLMTAGNPASVLLAVPIAVCGWLIPNFFLAGRVKARQAQVLKELPTIIDLLIVCAQAGLGLLMCVDKVSKEVAETCPVLSSELKQLINDVKIFAKSVPHALAEMGERCGVEELINMASALIAAETKGSDISYPLRQQSEALRDRLKRRKEEQAAKVPVKMVPVIMLFIMPLIMCPMLGPAVITIMQALGPVFGGSK
ncbi:MAG: type II secretion system F family protein [Candidatus Melainabacteria bacterium]|nr:type II secretion system F family protein [Candidatus Melainabacteria bacterium]